MVKYSKKRKFTKKKYTIFRMYNLLHKMFPHQWIPVSHPYLPTIPHQPYYNHPHLTHEDQHLSPEKISYIYNILETERKRKEIEEREEDIKYIMNYEPHSSSYPCDYEYRRDQPKQRSRQRSRSPPRQREIKTRQHSYETLSSIKLIELLKDLEMSTKEDYLKTMDNFIKNNKNPAITTYIKNKIKCVKYVLDLSKNNNYVFAGKYFIYQLKNHFNKYGIKMNARTYAYNPDKPFNKDINIGHSFDIKEKNLGILMIMF